MNSKSCAKLPVITLISGGITLAYSQGNNISPEGNIYATSKVSFAPESIFHIQQVHATPAATSYLYVIKTSHSDRIGSEPNKQSIIPGIARSVLDPLIVKSVDPTRIKVFGKGEAEPIALYDSFTGNARNRVIELEAGTL